MLSASDARCTTMSPGTTGTGLKSVEESVLTVPSDATRVVDQDADPNTAVSRVPALEMPWNVPVVYIFIGSPIRNVEPFVELVFARMSMGVVPDIASRNGNAAVGETWPRKLLPFQVIG